LIASTIAVYAPVWGYQFVEWDDPRYVSSNPIVLSGLNGSSIQWALTTSADANWFPLTWISLMFDAQLHGLHAGGYHITNLLLHIACALLLFGFLYEVTHALAPSGFVAALFALHPMHVESVAWVAERKDVLSTLFWMLTMCAYVRYVRRPNVRRYLLVLTFF